MTRRINNVWKSCLASSHQVKIFDVLSKRFLADEENIVRVVNILQTLLRHGALPGQPSPDGPDDLDGDDGDEDDEDDDDQADVDEVVVNKVRGW